MHSIIKPERCCVVIVGFTINTHDHFIRNICIPADSCDWIKRNGNHVEESWCKICKYTIKDIVLGFQVLYAAWTILTIFLCPLTTGQKLEVCFTPEFREHFICNHCLYVPECLTISEIAVLLRFLNTPLSRVSRLVRARKNTVNKAKIID